MAWLRNLFPILFLLVSIAPGRAAIGDDLPTLRSKYGSASLVGNQMLFQHDGYSIAVYFDGTRSGMEIFVRDGSKKDKTDMTQEDIDSILVLEGEGQSWHSIQTQSGEPTWLRLDGKLIARFNPNEKILAIITNSK